MWKLRLGDVEQRDRGPQLLSADPGLKPGSPSPSRRPREPRRREGAHGSDAAAGGPRPAPALRAVGVGREEPRACAQLAPPAPRTAGTWAAAGRAGAVRRRPGTRRGLRGRSVRPSVRARRSHGRAPRAPLPAGARAVLRLGGAGRGAPEAGRGVPEPLPVLPQHRALHASAAGGRARRGAADLHPVSARGPGPGGRGRARTGGRSGGSGVGGRAFVRAAGARSADSGAAFVRHLEYSLHGEVVGTRSCGDQPRRAPRAPRRRSPLPPPRPGRPSPPGARGTPRPPSSSPSPPSSSCPSPSPHSEAPLRLPPSCRNFVRGPSVTRASAPGAQSLPPRCPGLSGARFSRACPAPQARGGAARGWSPGLGQQGSEPIPRARPSLRPELGRARPRGAARLEPTRPCGRTPALAAGLRWGSGPCGRLRPGFRRRRAPCSGPSGRRRIVSTAPG